MTSNYTWLLAYLVYLDNMPSVYSLWIVAFLAFIGTWYLQINQTLAIWLLRFLLVSTILAMPSSDIIILGGILLGLALVLAIFRDWRSNIRAGMYAIFAASGTLMTFILILTTFRAIDNAVLATTCFSTGDNVNDIVFPIVDQFNHQVHPQLAQLHRGEQEIYCNLDLSRLTLFTPSTLDAIEKDQTLYILSLKTKIVKQEIACGNKAKSNDHSDRQRGIALSTMALIKLDGIKRYVQGPGEETSNLRQAILDFELAQDKVPSKPGFWDQTYLYPEELPFYVAAWVRFKLPTEQRLGFLKELLRFFFSHNYRYRAVRRAKGVLDEAMRQFAEELIEYRDQRYGNVTSGAFSDEQFRQLVEKYTADYHSGSGYRSQDQNQNPTQPLGPLEDRALIDAVLDRVNYSEPSLGSVVHTVDMGMKAWTNQTKKWSSWGYCSRVAGLGPKEKKMWNGYWDKRGGRYSLLPGPPE